MVIFHSYVTLPEGTRILWAKNEQIIRNPWRPRDPPSSRTWTVVSKPPPYEAGPGSWNQGSGSADFGGLRRWTSFSEWNSWGPICFARAIMTWKRLWVLRIHYSSPQINQMERCSVLSLANEMLLSSSTSGPLYCSWPMIPGTPLVTGWWLCHSPVYSVQVVPAGSVAEFPRKSWSLAGHQVGHQLFLQFLRPRYKTDINSPGLPLNQVTIPSWRWISFEPYPCGACNHKSNRSI